MRRFGVLAFAILLALSALRVQAEAVTVEGIAAYVNDAVITVGDVKDLVAPLVPQMRETYRGREFDERYREAYGSALRDLVATKLIMKAYEADTKVNKEAVEKHVDKKVNEFIQERFDGDRQAFLKALKSERLSLDDWRKRLRETVVVGLMRNREVESQAIVSPREVRRAYEENSERYRRPEQVRLRVILVHGSTNATDRAVRAKLADEIAGRLKAGEDFADQARRFSEDGKSDKGGDWGWMDLADLRPELARAVAGTPAGSASGVIDVDGDYYLVKVEERHPAGQVPFEDVRAAIEKDLLRKETRRLFDLWIERLKKDAYIEIVKTAGP